LKEFYQKISSQTYREHYSSGNFILLPELVFAAFLRMNACCFSDYFGNQGHFSYAFVHCPCETSTYALDFNVQCNVRSDTVHVALQTMALSFMSFVDKEEICMGKFCYAIPILVLHAACDY